jgi:SpoVK/Ycf46/Vps4 family AAA+-type ATPase
LSLDARIRRQVDEFVRFVKAADRLLASRVGIAPSMLIYGPPGVGKTELARFIAGELQLPLITARSDSLISSFLGSTAKNLRLLFDHARNRPCILFLDEFDSVAKLRDDQHELGELKRVVVSLLQNIDALDNQTVLLAATNHHHLLDPAVWRRFAYRGRDGSPDLESRRALFELFLHGYAPARQDVGVFASLADGLTGADIRRICESAIRAAVLDDRNEIEPENTVRGIIEFRLGREADFSNTDPSLVRAIHALDPKHLTLKRLAALFDSSEPTISRRLNVGGRDDRKRKKVTDKGRAPTG